MRSREVYDKHTYTNTFPVILGHGGLTTQRLPAQCLFAVHTNHRSVRGTSEYQGLPTLLRKICLQTHHKNIATEESGLKKNTQVVTCGYHLTVEAANLTFPMKALVRRASPTSGLGGSVSTTMT